MGFQKFSNCRNLFHIPTPHLILRTSLPVSSEDKRHSYAVLLVGGFPLKGKSLSLLL